MANIAAISSYNLYNNIKYSEIPGVNDNELSLDIYQPDNMEEGEILPVLVYVHGGSWNAGDKSNVAYKAEFFPENGYIFVSTNYRLSPNPPETKRTASTFSSWLRG